MAALDRRLKILQEVKAGEEITEQEAKALAKKKGALGKEIEKAQANSKQHSAILSWSLNAGA